MAASIESVPAPAQAEQQTPVAPTNTTDVSSSGGKSTDLRALSYDEGAAALAPDGGAVPTAGGDTDPMAAEVSEVAKVHELTIDALQQKICEVAGIKVRGNGKTTNRRRPAKKKSAAKVQEIFAYLGQFDSKTITAAWLNVKAEAAEAFDETIDAIGYKGAARAFPREAKATLKAADAAKLTGFAEGCLPDDTFAAELAVGAMESSAAAEFRGLHPELAEQVSVDEQAVMSDEVIGSQDVALRATEEAYRDQAKSDNEAQKAESDTAAQQMQDANSASAQLVAAVTGLIDGGKAGQALIKLASGKAALASAAHGLDTSGKLSLMFSGLSFDEKWNTYPQQMKRVLAARSSDSNIAGALKILDLKSNPTFEKTVTRRGGRKATRSVKRKELTSVEAYAAYQFLKALPAGHREGFRKAYPGLVVAMETHLNDSMRGADDTNFHGADGGDQQEVAQLLTKIQDVEFWLTAPAGQLEMTLKLTLKAGERSAIGEQLQAMSQGDTLKALHADDARRAAVESALGTDGETASEGAAAEVAWLSSLKLAQTITQDDKDLAGNVSWFHAAGVITRANRAHNKKVSAERKAYRKAKRDGKDVEKPTEEKHNLLKQALGGKDEGFTGDDIALDQLQDVIDDFGAGTDAQFKDYGKRKGDNQNEDRNRADVRFDPNAGILEFSSGSLELVSFRFPMGDVTVETGPVTIRDLELSVTWPTAHNPGQQSSVSITASTIDMSSVILTGPGLMLGIKGISATAVDISAAEQKPDFGDNPGAGEALKLLMKHNPARTLIGSYTHGNIEAQTPAVQEAFMGVPAGAQGGASMKLDSLEFTGVTHSAATYVAKGGIEGLELMQDTRPSVCSAARIAQLGNMVTQAQGQLAAIPADASAAALQQRERVTGEIAMWQQESTTLEAALPGWQKLESLYQKVYESLRLHGSEPGKDVAGAVLTDLRVRAAEAGIEGASTMELAEIARVAHSNLKNGAGAVLSLGELSVEGVEADGASVQSATVSDINLAGSGSALSSALNPKMMKRLGMKGVEEHAAGVDENQVAAHVGNVEVKGVSISGGKPMAALLEKMATKRTLLSGQDAAALKPAQKQALAALNTRWAEVLADGRTYGEVAEAMVALYKSPGLDAVQKDMALLGQWRGYEKAMEAHGITIQRLEVEGIQLSGQTLKDGDGAAAESKASIGQVTATGIQSGSASVASATMTGVSAQASAKLDKDGNVSAAVAEAGVKTIGAKDISVGDGTKIGDASIGGVNVSAKSDSEGSSFILRLGPIKIAGVGLKTGKEAAEARLSRLKADIKSRQDSGQPHADLDAETAAVRDGLASYEAAYGTQASVQGEVAEVQVRIDQAKGRLAAAEREASVLKHVDSKAAAKRDAARIAAIKEELTALANERAAVAEKLKKPNAIIASYESSLGLTGAGALDQLEVAVSTTASLEQLRSGDASGTYNIRLTAGPLTVPAIHYAAPGMDFKMGGATMPLVSCEASVSVTKVPKTDKAPESYAITQVNVSAFKIPEITATALKVTMGVEGEAVVIEMPTASIKGVSLTDVKLPGLSKEAFASAEGKFNLTEVSAAMSTKMGDSMAAAGELKLSNIHATALSSGAVNFGMDSLSLEKLGFSSKEMKETSGGRTIVSQLLSIGGKATRLGKVDINGSYNRHSGELKTTVGLDDLVLSGVNYAGGGSYLGIGYADLKGASVTVAAKFKSGKLAKGESPIEELWLDRLHVDRIYGKNISYKGKGQRRERFGNGTEKVTAIEQAISLKKGTLHGLNVQRMRLDKFSGMAMSLGSADVKGLEVGVKSDGKQTLQANVSAHVQGVALSMVEDDLKLSMDKLTGDADVTMGEGASASHMGVHGATVKDVNAAVNNLGKANQTAEVDVASVRAQKISFGAGVAGSGHQETHALGSAQLNGIHVSDNADRTAITIKSGEGQMVLGHRTDGYMEGTYDPNNPDAITNDQVKVPQYHMTWEMGMLSKLDGDAKLKYPDGNTFLALNFDKSIIKLNTDDNIKQMWKGWCTDIYSGGEIFNMGAWQNRWDAITNIDDNLLWTALFKGIEFGFNTWGESILGKWVNVEKMVVDALNAKPETTLVEAKEQSFFNLQGEINKVIEEYVDPTIKTVCDYGVAYDAIKGNYGRAATDAGLWIWDKVVDSAEWVTGDDYGGNEYADEERKKIREARELECKQLVDQFLSYVMGWGVDVDLNSTGAGMTASKTPMPNPKSAPKRQVISTMLDVHAVGGGSLGGGFKLNANGVMNDFQYKDGGTSVGIDQVTLQMGAKGGVKKTYDETTGRYTDMDPVVVAGTRVGFTGLSFELDKAKQATPDGVVSTKDGYAQSGNYSAIGQPTTDGNTTTHDAADYFHKQKSGTPAAGPAYSEKLSKKEAYVDKSIETVKNTASDVLNGTSNAAQKTQSWENTVVAAKNASVANKYEMLFQDRQPKKKKPSGS